MKKEETYDGYYINDWEGKRYVSINMDCIDNLAEKVIKKELSTKAFFIFIVMARYMQQKKSTNFCTLPASAIAEKTGTNGKHIYGYLKELETIGVLKICITNYNKQQYYLLNPNCIKNSGFMSEETGRIFEEDNIDMPPFNFMESPYTENV